MRSNSEIMIRKSMYEDDAYIQPLNLIRPQEYNLIYNDPQQPSHIYMFNNENP